ncbi:hypothetical protein M422DRAFT_245063 [Sphaerobolus stellatus SS14]|nr:hypothetical protein M422DRAFT_245063 [Sphaerobolus stellatus SS14]
MKVSVSLATLAIVLGASAQTSKPQIQTPTGAQQCEPIQLLLSGGTPPYQISALPAGQTTAPPLETIANDVSGSTFTWVVNLKGGTSTTLQIRDANGVLNFSSLVTIINNTDDSCLNGTSTSSGSSSGTTSGTSTSSASSSQSSAPTTTTTTSTSPTTVAGTTSSSGSSASSTGSTGSSTNASSTGAPSTTSGATQTTNNAAVGLTSSSAASIIGVLLAYVLA